MARRTRRTIKDSFPTGSLDLEKLRQTFAELRDAGKEKTTSPAKRGNRHHRSDTANPDSKANGKPSQPSK